MTFIRRVQTIETNYQVIKITIDSNKIHSKIKSTTKEGKMLIKVLLFCN